MGDLSRESVAAAIREQNKPAAPAEAPSMLDRLRQAMTEFSRPSASTLDKELAELGRKFADNGGCSSMTSRPEQARMAEFERMTPERQNQIPGADNVRRAVSECKIQI